MALQHNIVWRLRISVNGTLIFFQREQKNVLVPHVSNHDIELYQTVFNKCIRTATYSDVCIIYNVTLWSSLSLQSLNVPTYTI